MSDAAWQFHTPTKLRVGLGISAELADELTLLGARRPLLVTDRGIIAAGIADDIIAALGPGGTPPSIYDAVRSDPDAATVAEGSQRLRTWRADAVVAVGGGSVVDAAKAMAIMARHDGDILDYEHGQQRRRFDRPGLPLITIPTTAGTGSEVTWWSVITDPQRRRKCDIGSPLMAARVALVDPALSRGLPPQATAATGFDALSHALEALVTRHHHPATDALCRQAIEMIMAHLPTAVANGHDLEARMAMASAASIAGLAFPNAGLGAVHGLTAPLGARLGIAHGQACAALLPAVMRCNSTVVADRYAAVASWWGWQGIDPAAGAAVAVDRVLTLRRQLGLPSLRELGCTAADVPVIAADAIGPCSNCVNNPRPLTVADLDRLLHDALDE